MEHGQQRLGYNIDIPIIAIDTFVNARLPVDDNTPRFFARFEINQMADMDRAWSITFKGTRGIISL